MECTAYLFRLRDVSFNNKRNVQRVRHLLDHPPVYGPCSECFWGESVESGCHGIGSRGFSYEGFVEGCNVGQDRPIQFGMNAGNQLPPRLDFDVACRGAVERDTSAPALEIACAETKSGVIETSPLIFCF